MILNSLSEQSILGIFFKTKCTERTYERLNPYSVLSVCGSAISIRNKSTSVSSTDWIPSSLKFQRSETQEDN